MHKFSWYWQLSADVHECPGLSNSGQREGTLNLFSNSDRQGIWLLLYQQLCLVQCKFYLYSNHFVGYFLRSERDLHQGLWSMPIKMLRRNKKMKKFMKQTMLGPGSQNLQIKNLGSWARLNHSSEPCNQRHFHEWPGSWPLDVLLPSKMSWSLF